jgi:hypothetical protein
LVSHGVEELVQLFGSFRHGGSDYSRGSL